MDKMGILFHEYKILDYNYGESLKLLEKELIE